jgi:hypothetical protein
MKRNDRRPTGFRLQNPAGCDVHLAKIRDANELLKHGHVRVVCRVQSKAIRVGSMPD